VGLECFEPARSEPFGPRNQGGNLHLERENHDNRDCQRHGWPRKSDQRFHDYLLFEPGFGAAVLKEFIS
jgi:hypothetical protein